MWEVIKENKTLLAYCCMVILASSYALVAYYLAAFYLFN